MRGRYFLALAWVVFTESMLSVSRGEVTPDAKNSMLEFFELIINYIDLRVTGDGNHTEI